MARDYKVKVVVNAEDKASGVLGGVGKSLTSLGKVAATAGLAAGAAVAGIGVAIGKLAIDAAPLEGIGIAFGKMSERVGLSLEDLREAAGGTVSDFELMRKANIALTGAGDQLGAEFGKNLPKLLEAARAAAKATGQDVDFLFESLVTGVKRGSPMLIDNTGLVVKLGEANEAMAAKLGIAVEDMTAEQKSIALLNATLEAGQRMVDEFGGGQLTAAERLAQFKATLQNTKDQLGLAFLPALSALMEPIGQLAQDLGPQLVAWAQVAGQWLGENLPKAIQTLSYLFNKELPSALQPVLSIFQAVSDVLSGPVLNAFDSIASWITTNWPIAQGVFLTVCEIIKAAALAIADVFEGQVLPPLQAAFSSLTEALAKLGLDWSDVWSALWEATKLVAYGIGAAILALIGIITGIVTAIAAVAEHVAGVLSDMAGTFMLGLESISSLIGGAMAVIRGIFTGDLDLILTGVRAWQSGLIGLFTAIGQGAINIFNLTFGTLIAAVSAFINGVIGFFTTLYETLVGGSIVQDMMSTMEGIIQEGVASIIGVFAGLVSSVIDTVSGLADSLYDVGASIMEGLKDGIMSKVDGILDAVRRAIQDIIDAAKDAVDIFSPSGVFMGIGKSMMEGLALGIRGGAGMPAMAAAGAAGDVARVTNNYFNMTVNTRATTPTVIQDFNTLRALV